jgi:hypothetical protein
MMALARHVGQRKVLIAKLVEVGIGAMATERLAENLTSLPEETLKQLPAKLDALPKSSSGAEMMMAEYEFALREVEPQTEGAASKPAAGKANTTKPATTRATTRALFGRAAMVQAMKAFYEAIGEASALPPEEFAKKVDEQMNKFAANPFAAIVAPSFKRSRETFAVAEAKQAMLRAAIDVILSGPDAVAKSRDPFGTGPFEYRETPGGFELKSALATRGKNAVLIVGRK